MSTSSDDDTALELINLININYNNNNNNHSNNRQYWIHPYWHEKRGKTWGF